MTNRVLIELTDTELTNMYAQKCKKHCEDFQLFEKVFDGFPTNTNEVVVLFKILLVDHFYSTALTMHKNKVTVQQLAKHICAIKDVDIRLQNGDGRLVEEIANVNGINLFAFASKYCYMHNRYAYHKDDYSIYDRVLCEMLPKFMKNANIDVKSSQLKKMRANCDYVQYNAIVGNFIKKLNLTMPDQRHTLDLIIWDTYRKQK